MLTAEAYKIPDGDEIIKQEIFAFFGAGMMTIQISSVNMIYYLTRHQEIREKLLKEIRPPLD